MTEHRDGQRRTSRRSRRIRLALLGLAAAVVVAVPVAWASHQFGDVPNTNPHHDDISGIALAGITTGCNPPTNNLYCPDQFVRRDQMASFLRRGLPRGAVGEFSASPVPTSYDAPVGAFAITPGLPANRLAGAAGFLMGNGQVTVYVPNTTGCPCEFMADLWSPAVDDDGYITGIPAVLTVHQPGYYTIGLAGMGRVRQAGETLVGIYIAQTAGTAVAHVFGQATAQYVPFGASGGNTVTAGADAKGSGASVPARPRRGDG